MKDKGKMVIQGYGFEEIMTNLLKSGYDVQIKVTATDNPAEAKYKIKYRKHIDPEELPFW